MQPVCAIEPPGLAHKRVFMPFLTAVEINCLALVAALLAMTCSLRELWRISHAKGCGKNGVLPTFPAGISTTVLAQSLASCKARPTLV